MYLETNVPANSRVSAPNVAHRDGCLICVEPHCGAILGSIAESKVFLTNVRRVRFLRPSDATLVEAPISDVETFTQQYVYDGRYLKVESSEDFDFLLTLFEEVRERQFLMTRRRIDTRNDVMRGQVRHVHMRRPSPQVAPYARAPVVVAPNLRAVGEDNDEEARDGH